MATNYFEMVLEGSEDAIEGFFQGITASTAKPMLYFFSERAGIKTETLSDIFLEWISLKAKIHHLVVEEELCTIVEKALKGSTERALLNGKDIKSIKKISSASFSFEFTTYGRKYGNEIKALLDNRPAGLTLSGYKPEESIDNDAKGTELYAPTHDYSLTGSGTVSGPMVELISFRKALDDNSLIEVEEIILKF